MNSLSSYSRMGRLFALTLAGWDRLAQWLIILSMTAMVTIVSLQVFLRYVLNNSIGWSDEISRLAFVWTIFLAIPLGVKTGMHLGINMLTARLPPRYRTGMARFVAALSAALMLLVCYETVVLTYSQWEESMATTNLSSGFFALAVAVGTGHTALHLIWIVLTGQKLTTDTQELEDA